MAHWIGELMHIATQTRIDISYATMILSGYMCCPKIPAYQELHQTMAYLYHHPHAPIFYLSKISSNHEIQYHFAKWNAELLNDRNIIFNYNDADLARDLQDRWSVTSTIHTLHNAAVTWTYKKQTVTSLYSNGAEIRALQSVVKQTIVLRNLLTNHKAKLLLHMKTTKPQFNK